MKKYIIYIILSLFISVIPAQTGNLQGNVSHNGEPLPGVNILVVNTIMGGVSDVNGFYRIDKIPAGEFTVRFSMVGYKTVTRNVEINEGKTLKLDITLQQDVINLGEIEVIDERGQVQSDTRSSLIEVKPESAKILPGAVTDVFRTLESLPGVLSPNDFSSQLVVRGSGPDQNLIIMDDIEVFNPYRLYGVISMFNPEAVSEINLVTGGFPAKYGDRLSAVLDVTNRQGDITEPVKGVIDASIVSANIVLEGKNPFDIPGSWLINSRRTYYDLIIEPFVKNTGLVEDNVSFPNFYDVQTKLSFGPFNGHKFFVNGIISRDGVELVSGDKRKTPDSLGVFNVTRNDLAGFAWHYSPDKKFLNKLILSWYRNHGDSRLDAEILDPTLNPDNFEGFSADTIGNYLLGFDIKSNFSFEKYSVADKLSLLWGNENEMEAGAGVDFIGTDISADFNLDPELQALLESNTNFRNALEDLSVSRFYEKYNVWAQNRFKISERFFLQPGVRFDYYKLLNDFTAAPRLSFSYIINSLTTLHGAWGIYYQSPGYEKIVDQNRLFDLSSENTKNLDSEKAMHFVLGIERWLNQEWVLKTEAYYKKFDDLIVQKKVSGISYFTEPVPGKDIHFTTGWTQPVPFIADSITQVPVNNSYGSAYGIELMLEKRNKKSGEKFTGWISYAYAVAERKEEGVMIPFQFDQRHTVNLVVNYKLSEVFDLGMRFRLGSGFPYTEPTGVKPRIVLKDTDGDLVPDSPVIATRKTGSSSKESVIYDLDFGGDSRRFNSRLPLYQRLDIRITTYAGWWDLDWQFYLDVINVYNHSNVLNYNYFIKDDLTIGKESVTMFPILPTLGFNVRF